MTEALDLARAMRGRVWPNPPVGCVIVRDGEIVGRGQTQAGGRPHAERVALDDAGPLARGGILYVTLEPCCHWGKTPPCADAIIAAGVVEVHASLLDPDPLVNGGGFSKLREAGLTLEVGLGANAAREVMAGFFMRVAEGRPLITVAEIDYDPAGRAIAPAEFDGVVSTQSGFADEIHISNAGGDIVVPRFFGQTTPEQIAMDLGALGLTSVVIPNADRLAGWFDARGLVDRRGTELASLTLQTQDRPTAALSGGAKRSLVLCSSS